MNRRATGFALIVSGLIYVMVYLLLPGRLSSAAAPIMEGAFLLFILAIISIVIGAVLLWTVRKKPLL